MDAGQVLQEATAQIEFAVASDLVGGHDHARAGHGRDARVATKGDGHAVVPIGHHRVRQHLFLGHGHLPPVEKNHATPDEHANQRVQLGRRQSRARGAFEQAVGLQIALLDLHIARLGRPR